MVGNWFNQL